jgi:hypothetical protein
MPEKCDTMTDPQEESCAQDTQPLAPAIMLTFRAWRARMACTMPQTAADDLWRHLCAGETIQVGDEQYTYERYERILMQWHPQ